MSTRTALYRHFDAAGRLLYVGISLSAVQRLAQHRDSAGWYGEIARVEVEWKSDRGSALAAEAIAIARENPRHNRQRPVVSALSARVSRSDSSDQLGVRHVRTGRVDGWYSRNAQHMLGWFRAMFPDDTFDLVKPVRGAALIGFDVERLYWPSFKEWASTVTPHFAAGDAFDRECSP